MGTRTARTKLETKIRYQKEVIVQLQEALAVAHKARIKVEEDVARVKQDVEWQRKRVAERDKQIKELRSE